MTSQCKVCNHHKRLLIDRRLAEGTSPAVVSREFAISYDSVVNHYNQGHLTRQLTQAMQKKATEESFNLLERIDTIVNRAEQIFLRNYAKGADVTALKALDSQRNTFDLLQKISFQLHQAKMAELELARLHSGETSVEAKNDLQKSLAVLTLPELLLLQKLQLKLETQDSSIKILPSEGQVNGEINAYISKGDIREGLSPHGESKPRPMIRTIQPRNKLEDYFVKEIPGSIIPS